VISGCRGGQRLVSGRSDGSWAGAGIRLTPSHEARTGLFRSRYDRQVRMFGRMKGQRVLRGAKVAIVGLGRCRGPSG